MKNKKRGRIFLILAIVLILIISGFVVLEFFSKRKPKPILSREFNLEEFKDATSAINETGLNENEEFKEFSASCESKGGGVVVGDKLECYSLAEDEGEGCKGDYACEYNCDFSSTIDSGDCTLIFTDKDFSEGTYTYKYECREDVKGECSQIPSSRNFEINGNELTETGYREFPGEEQEFSPA